MRWPPTHHGSSLPFLGRWEEHLLRGRRGVIPEAWPPHISQRNVAQQVWFDDWRGRFTPGIQISWTSVFGLPNQICNRFSMKFLPWHLLLQPLFPQRLLTFPSLGTACTLTCLPHWPLCKNPFVRRGILKESRRVPISLGRQKLQRCQGWLELVGCERLVQALQKIEK